MTLKYLLKVGKYSIADVEYLKYNLTLTTRDFTWFKLYFTLYLFNHFSPNMDRKIRVSTSYYFPYRNNFRK